MSQIRLVAVVGVLLAATLAALILILSRNRPGFAAIRHWAHGLLAMTAGLVIHALRGIGVPELAGVIVGNGLLFVALLTAQRSVCVLTGTDDERDVAGWWTAGLAVLGLTLLYFTVPDIRPRGALLSAVAAGLLVRTGMTLQLRSSSTLMRGRLLTSVIFYIWAALHIARAVYFAGSPPWEVFIAADALNAVTFLPTMLLAMAATFSIAWMQFTSLMQDPEVREVGAPRDPVHAPDQLLNWLCEFRATQPLDDAVRTRVFVVDDDRDFVGVAAPALQLAGYAVSTARSADEALRLVTERALKPNVVVADAAAAGVSAEAGLAQRLRGAHPGVGIVWVSRGTGVPDPASERDFSAGRKPVAMDALVRLIEQAKLPA